MAVTAVRQVPCGSTAVFMVLRYHGTTVYHGSTVVPCNTISYEKKETVSHACRDCQGDVFVDRSHVS